MSKSNLPEGWSSMPLGAFMDFKNGVNADKRAYGKGIKFVNIMDIFRKNFLTSQDIDGSVEITDKQLNEYSVVSGDILFNRTSETPEEIAFSSVYVGAEKITFGGFVIRGRQNKKLLTPEYAKYCFKTNNVRKEMIRRSQGAVRANIGQKDLSKIHIVIPPESEQKEISETIEQWDTAIEKTEALIDAKGRQFGWFCTSLIKKMPVNGADTPISDLYELKKGDGLSKADITEAGKNSCILYGQLYTTYGEVINQVYSRTDKKNGVRSVSGDILIPASTTTSAIDLANVTALLENNVLLGGDINILRPKTEWVSSEFMAYYLTHYKKHELAKLAQGITIIHLYGKDIKSVRVSLPDIDTQHKVVKLLNTARYEIHTLKKLADQYRTQKCGLMQKLLSGKWSARHSCESRNPAEEKTGKIKLIENGHGK